MQPIDIFLQNCLSGLKRIARASHGDLSLDDVKGEAWVMDHELALSGKQLDLTSPIDQDAFLGKLYGKLILSMRTAVGFARRLDKGWDDDEAGQRLGDILEAAELSDPLKALEQREELSPLELACVRSYSQATAYAVCLHRWDSPKLASYLGIQVGSLHDRIRLLKTWVEYQPSIFDGIERISLEFMPLQRLRPSPSELLFLNSEQYGLKL